MANLQVSFHQLYNEYEDVLYKAAFQGRKKIYNLNIEYNRDMVGQCATTPPYLSR